MPAASVGRSVHCLRFLLTTFSFVLASCASVPPQSAIQPVDGVEVPGGWSDNASNASDPTPLAQWWVRFNDPLLSDLVAQALQVNTSVATAHANVMQSRALRDAAAAALWPDLSATASVQQGSAGGQGTPRQRDVGLAANWVPDVFGANRNALDGATATLAASIADVAGSRLAVASEVGLSYILLREGQARLLIATSNLASQTDTLQIAAWREQAGLATALETAQARTAVEQTRALVPALQTSIDQTGHALAVLTGHAPAALQALLRPGRGAPHDDRPLVLSIPADTLRQRADVRAAAHRVSAGLSHVSQAEAARFPGFAIAGSLGLNAAGSGTLFRSGAVLASLLASATMPLFDGGAVRAEVHFQQAALELERSTYRATVLSALKEVEDDLRALAGDRDRVVSLRAAAQAAAQAALLSRQRFASGLIDFQVVLETQRTQLVTEDGLATAEADVSSDLVRLYVALGGGWREDAADERAQLSVREGWVWSP